LDGQSPCGFKKPEISIKRQGRNFSASLALRFFEFFPKLRNVLARRLPIYIAGIAVKSERTSAQLRLKLVASEGDSLAVIIRAHNLEFRSCSHSLWTGLKGSERKRKHC
jgi:hypothetical protein